MPLYQIKNWKKHFENSKSREREQCRFVCMPNKQDGMGLMRVLNEPDGAAIYGIWALIVQKCGRQRSRDGWMTADGQPTGTPWTPSALALSFRRPLTEITRALEVVSSQDVDWVAVWESLTDYLAAAPALPADCPPRALEEKRREEKGSEGSAHALPGLRPSAAPALPADCPPTARLEATPTDLTPTLEEVCTEADMRGIPKKVAEKFFFDRDGGNWLKKSGVPIVKWKSDLRGFWATWQENEFKHGGKKGASPEAQDLAQLEAELAAETDGEKRRGLHEKIRRLEGGAR